MKINFLRPRKGRATKTFIFDKKFGEWELKQGYQAGKYFDSYSYPVKDIESSFEIIRKYQNHPVFMIQGDFIEGVGRKNIVRRKRADRDDSPPTLCDRELSLICFDVDGFKTYLKGPEAIEEFIAELPGAFWEADYFYQFSASYGLTSNALKCHLFFWLETPAHNLDVREWVISYNLYKGWDNILDPAVFVATQPVYTQRRICSGAPDPIKDFIDLIKKSGALDWSFPPRPSSSRPATIARKKAGFSNSPEKYSIQDSISKILSGASFHDEINKLSLSMMGQGLPARIIKETIKGMMNAARDNIKDSERLRTWQTRFDDIDRSVDTAFDLVDNPSQEDFLNWLKVAPPERVLKEFPGKSFKKTPAELKVIIQTVAERCGVDKRDLKKRVKGFKEKAVNEDRQQARKLIFESRRKKGIFEVVVNQHNAASASEVVAGILSNSPRWPPVFACGPRLVSVDFEKLITIGQMAKKAKMKKSGKKYCRIPTIHIFEKPYHDLIARLGKDIRFIKKPLGAEVPCPDKLATIIALGREKSHRELTGIVQAPFVQENWEIFNKTGYDPGTGLFSVIQPEPLPQFLHPIDAFDFLKNEVFAEFPFQRPLDATVMIAAMMALLQRPLLAQDTAGMPGFAITAPVQSSGKTTLVNIVTTAILKTSIPASTFSSDDEELRKHIMGLLMEGHSCILFDNITEGTEIKSDVLAAAMSSEIHSDRLLGLMKTKKVASAAIWFLTGNNIKCSGDFATRIYPIFLNPLMENPDTRKFIRKNVVDWTLENRPQILSALLSICRSGRDCKPLETGSRFALWDKYIRAPLYTASKGEDVNLAIITNKEHDEDFNNKKKLVNAMWKEFKEDQMTSREIIKNAFDDSGTPENVIGELLEEILGKYAQNTKSLGRLLSKMVSRTYGDLYLSRIDTDRAYWYIERHGEDE